MTAYEFNMVVAFSRCMLLTGVLLGFLLHVAVKMAIDNFKKISRIRL